MAKSRNPGKQIVETIKKVTTQVGVVKDLYGDVFLPVKQEEGAVTAGWYFFKIASTFIPSLGAVYERAVEDNLSPEFLPIGSNNKANLGSTVVGEDSNNVLFLVAGVEVSRPLETKITVECENSDIVIFINNKKVAEGEDSLKNRRIFLDSLSKNVIQILIRRRPVGGTKVFYFDGYVQLDPTIPVIFSPLLPGAVEWADSGEILYGSLDGNPDHVGVILTFKDNPFASGWIIDRYSYKGLGGIFEIGESGHLDSGNYKKIFAVSGIHAPANVLAVAGGTMVGYISSYANTDNNTNITVDVFEDVSIELADELMFYEYLDTATIAELGREGVIDLGADVRFVDTSVVHGMPYSYKIAARAFHDKSLTGPYSELRTALAYDNIPPGPIVLWPNEIDAVTAEGPLVTVTHIYPSDEDLAGYRIYLPLQPEYVTEDREYRLVVDLGLGTDLLRVPNFIPSGVDPQTLPNRYGEFDFFAKEIKEVNVELVVEGYVCTTYDFAGNELAIVDGTEFTVTFLVLPPENFTAYDHLVSPALGQRKPEGIPNHMWVTALDLKLGQETDVESM